MLFKNNNKRAWIVDVSFYIYSGAYSWKSPCRCIRIERDDSKTIDPSCERCDGTGLAYMASTNGVRTGGIYQVLVQILRAIDQGYEPILVFDPPKENLDRTQLHDDYKGNRKECPVLIKFQADFVETWFPYMSLVKCYTSNNHESDDVMATLAIELANDGYQVVVASDDKDMFPLLINKNIKLFRQKAFFTKDDFYDKFGFYPERFMDYLAVRGDAADNYNLIKGLGDKAAKEIILKYDNIDSMLEDKWSKLTKRFKSVLDELNKSLTFEKLKDEFTKSLKLAELNTSVEYELLSPDPDREMMLNYFKDMNLYLAINNIDLLCGEEDADYL